MNPEIRKYSVQLRRLVEEYYQQQMPMGDYRSQRKRILDQLETEFAGNADAGETRRHSSLDPATKPP